MFDFKFLTKNVVPLGQKSVNHAVAFLIRHITDPEVGLNENTDHGSYYITNIDINFSMSGTVKFYPELYGEFSVDYKIVNKKVVKIELININCQDY